MHARLRSISRRLALAPLVLMTGLAVAGAGCTVERHTFPGQEPEVLWTAMVAVADTPDYGADEPDRRWSVKENVAHADPDDRRIEIYREIVRHSDLTTVRPKKERRTFRFQVELEEFDPPTVAFRSRGTGVPRHAQEEADRYFADVAGLVGDRPPPPGPAIPAGGASTPEVAVRDLLYAMFRLDEAAVRRIIIPAEGEEVLWRGDDATVLPPLARERLDRRVIRPARAGERVVIDGHTLVVTETLVSGDRRLILASVAGQELAPFIVVRTPGGWRVDASRIIGRRLNRGRE